MLHQLIRDSDARLGFLPAGDRDKREENPRIVTRETIGLLAFSVETGKSDFCTWLER